MQGHFTPLDVIVLLLYVAGVVGYGAHFARRSQTPEGFMAAGRALPGWAVGLSIFGTYVSSISFLALPGKAYGGNWNAFAFSLSLPFAAWCATRWFTPLYRRRGEVSAYSFLEARFGPWARVYATACYLLTQLARVGSILYLVALALHSLLGWSVPAIIIATGAVVTAYTVLGGIEAVIWTDVVQSVVLTTGAVACAGMLLFDMPGGAAELFAVAASHGKFSLGQFDASLTQSTFWVVLVYGLFINLQNFGIDQSYVQRYITARSDAAAGRSVWVGALLYIPVSALFLFIGVGLFAYYQARPEALLPSLTVADAADKVFPWFIVTQLPPGVTGLLIAALFAAAMSSVDSSLNCSATLFLTDIHRRFLCPDADDRHAMRVLHAATVAWGAAGTTMALAMIRVKSALDAWWQLAGVFSGGMLGLLLLGLAARRVGGRQAAAATCIGVLTILWLTFSPRWTALAAWRNPLHPLLTCVVGATVIFLCGVALGRRMR